MEGNTLTSPMFTQEVEDGVDGLQRGPDTVNLSETYDALRTLHDKKGPSAIESANLPQMRAVCRHICEPFYQTGKVTETYFVWVIIAALHR